VSCQCGIATPSRGFSLFRYTWAVVWVGCGAWVRVEQGRGEFEEMTCVGSCCLPAAINSLFVRASVLAFFAKIRICGYIAPRSRVLYCDYALNLSAPQEFSSALNGEPHTYPQRHFAASSRALSATYVPLSFAMPTPAKERLPAKLQQLMLLVAKKRQSPVRIRMSDP
jgi:hypothetical protein